MLSLLLSILGILLTIFLVVGVHEFGHFIVARLVGVKVLLFSIGFGKSLYRWHDKKGTEYIIAAIPLGGYVKMLDEREEEVPKKDLPFAYNTQPFYKKLAIVIAGPLFNVLFAFFIYWALFVYGFVGLVPLIGNIKPDSIAAISGMKSNQEIIAVDEVPTKSWMSVIVNLLMRAGDKTQLSITTEELTTHQQTTYQLPLTDWELNELKPDPLDSLGIEPFEPVVPPVIGDFSPDSPVKNILKKNDTILAIYPSAKTPPQPIKTWQDLSQQIASLPDTTVTFKILRAKKVMEVPIHIGYQRDYLFKKHGYLGITPDFVIPEKMIRQHKYSLLQGFYYAWHETIVFCKMNLILFEKLITGKISLASLGGPITIFQSAGTAIHQGILPFFSFIAFLSIAIGLVNIFPIPGLDGGHVVFQVIELVLRRPISIRVQVLFYRLGLILLFLLIFQAIINDISRL